MVPAEKLIKGHKYFFKRGKKCRIINCKNCNKTIHWRIGDLLIDLTLCGLDKTVKTAEDANNIFCKPYIDYEPYIKPKKTQFPITLKRNGDVMDSIEFKDGEMTIVRPVGTIELPKDKDLKYKIKRPK